MQQAPEHYFYDKFAIPLHHGTCLNENFASQRQNYAQKLQDAKVNKSLPIYQSLHLITRLFHL